MASEAKKREIIEVNRESARKASEVARAVFVLSKESVPLNPGISLWRSLIPRGKPRPPRFRILREILQRSDEESILYDWCKVGRDLSTAMDRFANEQEKPKKGAASTA